MDVTVMKTIDNRPDICTVYAIVKHKVETLESTDDNVYNHVQHSAVVCTLLLAKLERSFSQVL